jgi:DNA-binding NarL/FixJ family response regulator
MTQPVIILDDHPLVARGIAKYIEAIKPEFAVLIASSAADMRELIDAHGAPLLVVADVWLDASSLLEDLAKFLMQCPTTPWLAMSGDDDPSIPARVHSAGAKGFIHKRAPPEIMALAIDALLSGGQWFETLEHGGAARRPSRAWLVTPAELGLTPRQGVILELLLRGLPNKRIALMLDVAESTVKEHVTKILYKLGVRTRVEAITKMRGQRLMADALTHGKTAVDE